MLFSNKQFIALGVGVLVTGYLIKRGVSDAVESINPTNPDNVINQGAQAVVGKETLQSGFDHLFATVDLINPFQTPERKAFALKVWTGDN